MPKKLSKSPLTDLTSGSSEKLGGLHAADRLPGKLGETLNELEAALHAWDEAEKQGAASKSSTIWGATAPPTEPLYEKALIKELYKQLQELSKD